MCFHGNLAALSRVMPMLAFVALVAACAGDPREGTGHGPHVEGKMLHTPERFSGESTASIDGAGSISLTSDTGARCGGPYRQVPDDSSAEIRAKTSNNGIATLTCTDGRTGSVMFTVGPRQAIGTGMLGQDIVTLTIDD